MSKKQFRIVKKLKFVFNGNKVVSEIHFEIQRLKQFLGIPYWSTEEYSIESSLKNIPLRFLNVEDAESSVKVLCESE